MNTPTWVRTTLVGTALALISLLLVWWLERALGTTAPLLPLVGIVVATWYGGLPCGFIATTISVVLAPLTLPPVFSFRIFSLPDQVRLALLIVLGITTTLLVAYMRRTAETLSSTLTSIGDAVLVTDAEGRVVRLNEVAEKLTGWTMQEARGRAVTDVFRIVNEHTRRPAENPAHRALREGVTVGLANHTILIARDGTERVIDDSAAPVRHHSGRITGAVLVFRDDSVKRAAERKVRATERRFRALIEASAEVFWAMDATGRITEDSPSWSAFTGQGEEARRATGGFDMVHPDDREGLRREVEAAMAAETPLGASFGLGLGLAIVRSVVEAHEGTVEAHSEGEQRGATFIVRLPAAISAPGV